MEGIVIALALFFSLAYAAVGITRVIVDGRVRRRLLESNASPEIVSQIVAPPRSETAFGASMQWGLLLGAVGIALVIIQFLPFGDDDPIVAGILLVAAAVGLLGYNVLERRMALGKGGTPARIDRGAAPEMIARPVSAELLGSGTSTPVPR